MISKKVTPSKIILHTIIILFCICCIVPILAIAAISLTTDQDIYLYGGYKLIPKTPTFYAYKFIFKDSSQIIRSFLVSIITTGLGTFVSVVLTIGIAYPLSVKGYRFRKILLYLIIIPLVFNGGMVPTYIVMTKFVHLQNTIWAHILPFALFPFYIILLRTFFAQLPDALRESAIIDGARELQILRHIMLPLSKPALATITLFTLLRIWNDTWYTGMLYVDEPSLTTVPMLLQQMLNNIIYMRRAADMLGIDVGKIPAESSRMAMCLISIGIVLFIFPFFQKYFVRGLTVGSIKG